jgi:WD40 repeat protein
MRQCLA